jgi:hypothetical protein
MPTNHLEQLVAEWYEYQDYFVRRNVLVGPRPQGGYECELDIVAFNPRTPHLVHIEASMDADSWANRDRRFAKKFEAGRKYIPGLFPGFNLPPDIEQMAVLVFASKQNRQTVGGEKIVLVSDLLREIFAELRARHLASSAVSEHLPILRSFQFVNEYRQVLMALWADESK